jgi:uncharacterized protein YggE
MKTFFAALGVLCALTLNQFGQKSDNEPRVIEVSASAERWITPDEFTFKITLLERIQNKQKITIEEQETALRNELTTLGVDVAKDLTIYDISSQYFRQKKIKDVLSSKDYRLKLRDLNKIARLQELADRLNVARLDLIDSEHSEITRLRRETKMDAMKAAKDKADYLLGAIGQRAGKPVYIKEEPDETPRNFYSANASSNSISNISISGASSASDDSLSFSQVRLRYVIVAKFEIE